MTFLFQPPAPIEVETGGKGQPQRVRWRGYWYRVQEIHNHWVVHAGWWAKEVRVDVYQVQTHTGLLCIILYDRLKALWYLERIFD